MPSMDDLDEEPIILENPLADIIILDEDKFRPSNPILLFVYDTLIQLYAVAEFLWQSPEVSSFVQESLSQGWQGIQSSLRWDKVCSVTYQSRILQEKIRDSFINNILIYAGMVIAYEGWIKPSLRYLVPDLENSTTEMTYDYPIQAIFFAFYLVTAIKNSCINASILKELEKIAPNKNIPLCTDSLTDQKKADVESMIFYAKNLSFAKTGSWIATRWSRGMASLAYGQCFEEFNLTVIGTQNRTKIFSANNAWLLTFGMSFMFLYGLLNRFLTFCARDVSNAHIEEAATCFIFQIFVMLSRLRDAPLPGKKEGYDFFESERSGASKKLALASSWIDAQLLDPVSRNRLTRFLSAVPHFPPIKLVAAFVIAVGFFPHKLWQDPSLFFSPKLFSIESFMDVRILRHVVLLQADALKTGDNLLPYMRSASVFFSVVPAFAMSAWMFNARRVINALASMEKHPLRNQLRFLLEIAERKTKKNSPRASGYSTVNIFARTGITRTTSAGSLEEIEKKDWVVLKKSASDPNLYKLRLFDEPDTSYVKIEQENIIKKNGEPVSPQPVSQSGLKKRWGFH